MLSQGALVALCPIDRRIVFDPAGIPWTITVVYAEQAAFDLPVLYTVMLEPVEGGRTAHRVGVLVSIEVLKIEAPELTALAELARWLATSPPRPPAVIVTR